MEATNLEIWDRHYRKPQSHQAYPDENLIRLIRSLPPWPKDADKRRLLDYGCGSGRNIPLFLDSNLDVTGVDTSANAVTLCRERYPHARFLHSEDGAMPSALGSESFDIIVCWGVLHYLEPSQAMALLSRFAERLEEGGLLLGTLRKHTDTHFAGSEVSGSSIQLFDLEQMQSLLQRNFCDLDYGSIERIPLGDHRVVAHWFFRARKRSS
ncbi:MAG: class I SAM-dependent methyltransferase [Leptospiraceae bacterium]|nr:class I SAM-dependent methyltransferase [Leptospiraceae bacterium]